MEPERAVSIHWQERRLGRTLLRTYRDTIDLYDIFPNYRGRSRPTRRSSSLCCWSPTRKTRTNFASSTEIGGGRTRRFWSRFTKRTNIGFSLQRLLIELSRTRSDFVPGFT